MAKKIDLTKFKKPTNSYLQKSSENIAQNEVNLSTVSEKKANNKISKKEKTEKKGRPLTGSEPLNCVVSLNFSESEVQKIKNKAGMVPMTKYLRAILSDAKVI